MKVVTLVDEVQHPHFGLGSEWKDVQTQSKTHVLFG